MHILPVILMCVFVSFAACDEGTDPGVPGDTDGDGVGKNDNCPNHKNRDQADLDGDGLGDVCDPDMDGDGHDNDTDNCPRIANPLQEDLDLDGIGNLCDDDDDGDGDGDETDCDPDDDTIHHGAVEVCGDDIDNNCDDVSDEDCYLDHCGVVAVDETWGVDTWGHRVTCSVYVQGDASPTLTILDGARVIFEAGTGLFVGYSGEGGIAIDGDGDGDGVLLTSRQRLPGSWSGVNLGVHLRAGASLVGFTIEYAGGSANAAGLLIDAAPLPIAVADAVIENNSGDGVRMVLGGVASFTGTRFAHNERHGISVSAMSSLTGDFADNVLVGNGREPARLAFASLGSLRSSSSFVGNGTDHVLVLPDSGVAEDMGVTNIGVPYRVTGNLYVEGAAVPTLTIEDGSVFLFDDGVGLRIGLANDGNLQIHGALDGVEFSSATEGGPGAWDGLYFGTGATNSSVTGLTLEHAGAGENAAGIYVFYGTVELNGCTIRDNAGSGVGLRSGVLALHDTIVSGTTAISAEDGDGVHCVGSDASILGWSNNTISANARYPVVVPASLMAALDDASDYTGNGWDYAVNTGGEATEAGTWSGLGVPWLMFGETFVQDREVTVAGDGPVINIADATFLFHENGALKVGVLGAGDINVNGAIFASVAESPARGDWVGIIAGELASSNTYISNSTVEFAGSVDGNILLYQSTQATVVNSTIRGSANYGIFCVGGCDAYNTNGGMISGNVFIDNETGDTN